MAIPVTIEGVKYFATLPSLADFRNFRELLAEQQRKKMTAAIPVGLPDSELKRWLRLINEECSAAASNPFSNKTLQALAATLDGLAVLYLALLRHENPQITLAFTSDLVHRAEEGKPAALEAIHDINNAFFSMMAAKKNGPEVTKDAQPIDLPATADPSISTAST